jgi:ribonuclease HI
MLECYADGSCPKPHQPGGWAFVILLDNLRQENVYGSGRVDIATNNTMEIMAVLECMKRILRDRIPHRPVVIYSDSQYVVNGTNTWMHTWADHDFLNVANADLWRDMLTTHAKFNRIKIKWVKGHNGVFWNEHIDKLAGIAQRGRAKQVKSV